MNFKYLADKGWTNALAAMAYIMVVIAVIGKTEHAFDHTDLTAKWLVPVGMLSLLVLSVTVMGLLFAGRPVLLYLEGQKSQAVKLLLTTCAYFAGYTAILFLVLALISRMV